MIAALLLAQATVTPEAEALGLRLARAGTLATIAPMLVAKDIDGLIADHPTLSPADKERLREIGRRISADDLERLLRAFGHAYAARLSLDELRQLVAAAESTAARHQRAIVPSAMVEAAAAVGGVDVKGETAAAFCRETGKLCPGR